MKRDSMLTIRINKDLKDAFQQTCERYGISMSKFIIHDIIQFLQQQNRKEEDYDDEFREEC